MDTISKTHTTINKNEVIRNIISKKKSELFENYLFYKTKSLGKFDLDAVSQLEYRPREDRLGNDCHKNAALESKETGNGLVIGYVIVNYGSFANIVLHSVNYDEKKQIFYDTGTYAKESSGWVERIFFPLKVNKQIKKDIQAHLFDKKNIFPDLVMFIDGEHIYEINDVTKSVSKYKVSSK